MRICNCFSIFHDTNRFQQLYLNRNCAVSISFLTLVLICSILRTIVLNPDFITQSLFPYTGNEKFNDEPNYGMDIETLRAVNWTVLQILQNRQNSSNSGLAGKNNLQNNIGVPTERENERYYGSVVPIKGHNEKRHRRLPQCIIAGVRKGGTRALIEFLSAHPDIVRAKREQHFFSKRDQYELGPEVYRKRMPLSYENQVTIEKTPDYFTSYWAPYRIHKMNSTIKLIFVVREPVARAISEYKQFDLHKTKSFEQYAITKTGKPNKKYKRFYRSMYYALTKRWLSIFDRTQLHFVNGDLLTRDPVSELQKVESFLGIRPYFRQRHFFRELTKGLLCYRKWDGRENCLVETEEKRVDLDINTNVTEVLVEYFKPYNQKFFELIDDDFGWAT